MALAWDKPVYSSTVQTIGYDSETGSMLVTWNDGRVSEYVGVPEEMADQISKSPSVGSAIHSQIKNQFPHRYR